MSAMSYNLTLQCGCITRLRRLLVHDDGLVGPVRGREYSEGLLQGGVIVVLGVSQ